MAVLPLLLLAAAAATTTTSTAAAPPPADLPYTALFGNKNGTGETAAGQHFPCTRFPMMTVAFGRVHAVSEFDTRTGDHCGKGGDLAGPQSLGAEAVFRSPEKNELVLSISRNGVCRYCACSTTTKHPVLTPTANLEPSEPMFCPQILGPRWRRRAFVWAHRAQDERGWPGPSRTFFASYAC